MSIKSLFSTLQVLSDYLSDHLSVPFFLDFGNRVVLNFDLVSIHALFIAHFFRCLFIEKKKQFIGLIVYKVHYQSSIFNTRVHLWMKASVSYFMEGSIQFIIELKFLFHINWYSLDCNNFPTIYISQCSCTKWAIILYGGLSHRMGMNAKEKEFGWFYYHNVSTVMIDQTRHYQSVISIPILKLRTVWVPKVRPNRNPLSPNILPFSSK